MYQQLYEYNDVYEHVYNVVYYIVFVRIDDEDFEGDGSGIVDIVDDYNYRI